MPLVQAPALSDQNFLAQSGRMMRSALGRTLACILGISLLAADEHANEDCGLAHCCYVRVPSARALTVVKKPVEWHVVLRLKALRGQHKSKCGMNRLHDMCGRRRTRIYSTSGPFPATTGPLTPRLPLGSISTSQSTYRAAWSIRVLSWRSWWHTVTDGSRMA